MKIALFGGAFNPVHSEHLNIVLAAKENLGMDKIIVIPTNISPHKKGVMTARGKDRLEMCRLAFADIEGVEVSDCELKRGGVSYSYVTCRHFKKLYPNDELYFIIGSDLFDSFHLWREPEEVLKCVTLTVCARVDAGALNAAEIKKFLLRFNKELVILAYIGKAVSSTRVRALAALGEDTAGLVPESVRLFIRKRRLYELNELLGVKKYLTEERWQHTVRVAVLAAEYSRAAGVYEIDAITTAALHDCAKYLPLNSEELKKFVPPQGVPKPVMHQYSGAFVAEHTFGIKDEGILNAIRYHTSGRENMSNLEKLIFLADFLEEGRDFEGVDKLRAKLKGGLDGCLLAALEHQLNYLKSTGATVYPLTERAYKYIKEHYYD
ncbi:MAG: nicotinate (nicotinamide) nucleotide adenylyltransferase [Clostridia bacterium]|nr:nicotinate (nicotinamide) nucleotide adenylyltransferase [Clostridia bacterium]